jgi:hypothetical protein
MKALFNMNEYKLISNEVVEGNMNPLEAFTILRKHLADLEEAIEVVKPLAIDEAGKYGSKSFSAFGANFELRNGPGQWKYQGSAYAQAKERLKYIEELQKLGGGIDPETGEVIEAANKVEGKSTIAITFKG